MKTPIVLSTLVCPGVGQFMQHRWVTGLFYCISFIALFVWLMVRVLVMLFHNLNAALDYAAGGNEPMTTLSLPAILIPLGLALLVYMVNVIDVAAAERRRRRTTAPPGRGALPRK